MKKIFEKYLTFLIFVFLLLLRINIQYSYKTSIKNANIEVIYYEKYYGNWKLLERTKVYRYYIYVKVGYDLRKYEVDADAYYTALKKKYFVLCDSLKISFLNYLYYKINIEKKENTIYDCIFYSENKI